MQRSETDYTALIAKQNTEIIRAQHETNGYLRELVEFLRPKTNREVLQEMKRDSPQLFNDILNEKLRETSLGEVIEDYAKAQGQTPDEFLKHTEHIAKEILSELDESRRKTREKNEVREAKRAELMRQANEI